MAWKPRGATLVWVGDPGPLNARRKGEETAYRWVAEPTSERVHPDTCGRPGTGRSGHKRHGTEVCGLCMVAERRYSEQRRARDAERAAS